jgi:hypothetical protein
MSFILIGIVSIIICYKWGNWRSWKEYYSTILYFVIGDFVYITLTQTKPLWNLGEMLDQFPIFQIIFMIMLYPSTTILFLTFYPSSPSLSKQAFYILLWVCIFTGIEAIACLTGGFKYSNGWNLCYSFLFDLLMFPLLRLHFKKTLLVWPISVVLALVFVLWFKIPLSR